VPKPISLKRDPEKSGAVFPRMLRSLIWKAEERAFKALFNILK
jgi:hypothetical protein